MERKRGDVIDIEFDPVRGHEIRKTRPAFVVQNDIGNQYSPLVIVSPIRGAEHIKRLYPSLYPLKRASEVWTKKVSFSAIRSGAWISQESWGKEGVFPQIL